MPQTYAKPDHQSTKSKATNKSLIFELAIFLTIVLAIFGFTYFQKSSDHGQDDSLKLISNLNLYSLSEPINLLVAGADQEYAIAKDGYAYKTKGKFRGRTDTIIVFRFDPIQKKLSALNIPRDTKIYLGGQKPEKINWVNTENGPEFLKEVVESLLDLKINHYILINTKVIEEIIDEVGGVEVSVEKEMKYTDKTDGLEIDLKPGKQKLSGKESIGYLRFRHDSLGDIGRIQRQQSFFRSLKKKLGDPYLLAKLPKLVHIGLQNIQTDLSISQMLQFANFVRSVPEDKHVFATLPGDFSVPETQTKVVYEEDPEAASASLDTSSGGLPDKVSVSSNPYASNSSGSVVSGEVDHRPVLREKVVTVQMPFVSYWIANEAEVKKLIDKLFKYDYSLEGDEKRSISDIKVAIDNITGNPAASRELSRQLRERGFTVIDVSKSQKALPSSIYAQKGNLRDAKLISEGLNLSQKVKLISASMGNPLADITIVLGDDLAAEIGVESQKNN